MKVSIVIASYGDDRWAQLGDERAYSSAADQEAWQIVRVHQPDGNVATARNAGALDATGDWLIFLDADDELASGYVGAMQRALEQEGGDGLTLLLTPAVSYRRGRRAEPPKFWPVCDLVHGNWMVIGTCVPRALWEQVGGFDDRPDYGAYEDWAFWIKCVKAGARPVKVPKAIYVAHVEPGSRHRDAPRQEKLEWHYAVGRDHWPDVYNETWRQRNIPRVRVRGHR